MTQATRCIVVLGGSFDPVHEGHMALARYFCQLLFPDELRLIPAGQPWQKTGLQATPEQRIAMLELAFADHPLPVRIDRQEIDRNGPTYTIDTLRALRSELGADASIVFLIGADQLLQLPSWKDWQDLFGYAHLCAATRPGFALEDIHLPPEVARELQRRSATPAQLRSTSHGLMHVAQNLAIDVSSTAIRAACARGDIPKMSIPARVLDYIELHHLYREPDR